MDTSLDSEAMMMGTTAEELLDLYLSSSRPVVVLGSYLDVEEPRQLARLHRHPQRDEFVGAVKAMLVGGE
jgi:preprotein translocase subunit Sss1